MTTKSLVDPPCEYGLYTDEIFEATPRLNFAAYCFCEERAKSFGYRSDEASRRSVFLTRSPDDERPSLIVEAPFCRSGSCCDYAPCAPDSKKRKRKISTCRYATFTPRKWNLNERNCCVTVECRNPKALADNCELPYRFYAQRPHNEKWELTPDADCMWVRSIFCNKKECPLYEE